MQLIGFCFQDEQRNKEIEIKANWIRTRKEEGAHSTNILVTSKKNPIVDVDPFGPPLLVSSKQQNNTKSTKLAITAPTETKKESGKKEKEETGEEKNKTNKLTAHSAKQPSNNEQTPSQRRQSSKESDEEVPRRPKTALHHKSSTKHKAHHKKSLSRSPKKVTIDENVQVNPADVEQKRTSSVDELNNTKLNSSQLSLNKMSDSRFDEQFEQMFPDLASSQTDTGMQRESSTNSLNKQQQQQSTSNLFELTKSDQYFDDDFDDNDDILNVLN